MTKLLEGEALGNAIPPGQTHVAYRRRTDRFSMSREVQILEVIRYTPKQVVCKYGAGEIRFNLNDGSERGGTYGSEAGPVTPQVLDAIHRSKLDCKIRSLGGKLQDLSRELVQTERNLMSTEAMEARVTKLAELIPVVEALKKVNEGEERK